MKNHYLLVWEVTNYKYETTRYNQYVCVEDWRTVLLNKLKCCSSTRPPTLLNVIKMDNKPDQELIEILENI